MQLSQDRRRGMRGFHRRRRRRERARPGTGRRRRRRASRRDRASRRRPVLSADARRRSRPGAHGRARRQPRRRRGDRRLLRRARLRARSGPSRTATAPRRWPRRSRPPPAQALPARAPTTPTRWRAPLRRGLRRRQPPRGARWRRPAPTCASRATCPSGVLVPAQVNPGDQGPARAPRAGGAAWPGSTARRSREVLADLAPADPDYAPPDRREGAARGAGAGPRPGGRRCRTATTLHPGDDQPAGGGAARRGWRGSATWCPTRRARGHATSTPRCSRRSRPSSATTA